MLETSSQTIVGPFPAWPYFTAVNNNLLSSGWSGLWSGILYAGDVSKSMKNKIPDPILLKNFQVGAVERCRTANYQGGTHFL